MTPMSFADMSPAASPAFMSGEAVTGRVAIACRTNIIDLASSAELRASSAAQLPCRGTRQRRVDSTVPGVAELQTRFRRPWGG
jgi:hypothetical protein